MKQKEVMYYNGFGRCRTSGPPSFSLTCTPTVALLLANASYSIVLVHAYIIPFLLKKRSRFEIGSAGLGSAVLERKEHDPIGTSARLCTQSYSTVQKAERPPRRVK